MLISFTQTYGNDRRKMLEIYSRDQHLINFKNLFDINYYSFHNSSTETIDFFRKINKVENAKILSWNGITYPRCVENLIKILEKDNCTHFFFSQDDTFSDHLNDVNPEDLVSFVKEHTHNFMYNTGVRRSHFPEDLELDILKEIGNLIIYKNNSLNYKLVPHGGMEGWTIIHIFVVLIWCKRYMTIHILMPGIFGEQRV